VILAGFYPAVSTQSHLPSLRPWPLYHFQSMELFLLQQHHSLENMFWPHGNIYFYPFLLGLISHMPDKRIFQSELDLFIIHTYNYSQLENRVEIIKMFRSLPAQKRNELYDWAHNKLAVLLKTHRNITAHNHYKGKINELIVAFGNTSELKYVEKDSALKSYLTMRS